MALSTERTRFLVIGSGLAGLAFALRAAEHGDVMVLTKAQIADANTSYAQGGIAAAVGEADSWKLHEQDTLIAGAGICEPEAVRFLVQEAPSAINWLQEIGAKFDVNSEGELRLGLEGGHSLHRIVHFEDRTGWEIERAVVAAVKKNPKIRVIEHAFALDLLMRDNRCIGAAAFLEGFGITLFYADAVLLATGGCGRMYQHTTNPNVATADGIALADKIGAHIANMEFMQFHPTTLSHPQVRNFLITEAVRGFGGTLRNHNGQRFMYDYDPRLELAPRDIVARAIDAEMKKLKTWCVYLDMTHLKREEIEEEFPTIVEQLKQIGIEPHRDWIPVVPAQHYSCGGVVTDLKGRTNIAGLYAAGEVASTGVHGGNRLASNSLLEALVFAHSAAKACAEEPTNALEFQNYAPPHCIAETEAVTIRRALQHVMTAELGIVRKSSGMAEADNEVQMLQKEFAGKPDANLAIYPLETANLLIAAQWVIRGARSRKESVGLHYVIEG